MNARTVLAGALLVLAALYAAWWHDAGSVTLLVFAAPPLALALMLARWPHPAAFGAGVLALAWFSHGVMVAWSRPSERVIALIATILAVVVVFAANYPGLHARFGARRPR